MEIFLSFWSPMQDHRELLEYCAHWRHLNGFIKVTMRSIRSLNLMRSFMWHWSINKCWLVMNFSCRMFRRYQHHQVAQKPKVNLNKTKPPSHQKLERELFVRHQSDTPIITQSACTFMLSHGLTLLSTSIIKSDLQSSRFQFSNFIQQINGNWRSTVQ